MKTKRNAQKKRQNGHLKVHLRQRLAKVLLKCKRERNAKKLRKSEESASAVLMKYILEKTEEKPHEANVDAFLSGIAVTMKSFSPYYLNIAKQKTFSIISQLEM
jgi:hypothetical protein